MRANHAAARAGILLLALLAAAAAAHAATRTLGAAEFRSWNINKHHFDLTHGEIEGPATRVGTGSGCMVAPLDLRAGSVLHSITAHLYDDDPDGNFQLQLWRKYLGPTPTAELMATLYADGDSGEMITATDTTIADPIVDLGHVYFLATTGNCLDTSLHRIYDVEIDLDESIFADGFELGNTNAWNPAFLHFESLWLSGASFGITFASPEFDAYEWQFDPTLATNTLPNAYDGQDPPCLLAPVELPQGVSVFGLQSSLYDDRDDRALVVSLKRKRMSTGAAATTIAGITTSGASGWQTPSTFSITDPTVDNGLYWYYLDACISGGRTLGSFDLLVQAIRIIYTVP